MIAWIIRPISAFAAVALFAFGHVTAAAAQDSDTIRIAWQPDPNVPLYLAREKGYFEEQVEAEYVKFLAAPPMFAALESDSVDIADMGLAPFIIARSQGIEVKAIAVAVDVSATNVLVAQEDKTIGGPEDLKGLRVGAQRGTTPYFGLVRYLESGGLGIDDVEFVDLTAPNIVPAFRRGEIDAAWVWSPWQNMLVSMGGKPVTTNKEVGALAPQVWAVRTEWAEENPELVQIFLEVIDRSFQEIASSEELAIEQLVATLNIEPDIAKAVLDANDYPALEEQSSEDYALSLLATGDAGLSKAIAEAAGFLHSQDIIQSEPNPMDAIDPEPLKTYMTAR